MKTEETTSRSDSIDQYQPPARDSNLIGSGVGTRFMSGDTNFDTMMETPNALRFVSASFTSEEGSEDGGGKKRGKKRRKNRTG